MAKDGRPRPPGAQHQLHDVDAGGSYSQDPPARKTVLSDLGHVIVPEATLLNERVTISLGSPRERQTGRALRITLGQARGTPKPVPERATDGNTPAGDRNSGGDIKELGDVLLALFLLKPLRRIVQAAITKRRPPRPKGKLGNAVAKEPPRLRSFRESLCDVPGDIVRDADIPDGLRLRETETPPRGNVLGQGGPTMFPPKDQNVIVGTLRSGSVLANCEKSMGPGPIDRGAGPELLAERSDMPANQRATCRHKLRGISEREKKHRPGRVRPNFERNPRHQLIAVVDTARHTMTAAELMNTSPKRMNAQHQQGGGVGLIPDCTIKYRCSLDISLRPQAPLWQRARPPVLPLAPEGLFPLYPRLAASF